MTSHYQLKHKLTQIIQLDALGSRDQTEKDKQMHNLLYIESQSI